MKKVLIFTMIVVAILSFANGYGKGIKGPKEFKIDFDKCHYVKLGDRLNSKIKTKKAKPFSVICAKDTTVKCALPEGEIEYNIIFENTSGITFAYKDGVDSEVIRLNKKTKKAISQYIIIGPNYIGGLGCVGTYRGVK